MNKPSSNFGMSLDEKRAGEESKKKINKFKVHKRGSPEITAHGRMVL